MSHEWIEKLVQDRETETRRQQYEQKLAVIANSEASFGALQRFCAELEEAVGVFNEKNTDKYLGQFVCERREDLAITVVRTVDNSNRGQVTVSLGRDNAALEILHQPGGPEQEDRIDLQPSIDGQMYLWSQNKQISTTHAVERVLRKFIIAIPR